MVEQRAEDPGAYGVVQHVDHAGRTALVSWHRTYLAGADNRSVSNY